MTSPSDYAIRPILPAEHEALGAISVGSYLDGGLLLHGPEDPYAPRLRDVARRAAEARVLVAADPDGTIVGGVTLAFPGSAMAEIAGPGESEIRMLAVAPEAQGRGVGTALALACVERSRAEPGVERVVLCADATREGTQRLYRRIGFERAPRMDWSPVPGVLLWGFALDL